jgi:hypothetical protein
MAQKHVVYEWNTPGDFFLHKLLAGCQRLAACPDDNARDILDRCGSDCASFSFHINCTRCEKFPIQRQAIINELNQRNIPVLNGPATDMSKRFLQARCESLGLPTVRVKQPDDANPDMMVMVKTDLNYGGDPEKKLSPHHQNVLGISIPTKVIAGPRCYRVMPMQEVPEPWWQDPRLAIEWYVENDEDRKYRVYFAGKSCVTVVTIAPEAVKKVTAETTVGITISNLDRFKSISCPQLPPSLQGSVARLVESLGVHFGALDLVQDRSGLCYIIDFNATSNGKSITGETADALREGLLTHIAAAKFPPDPGGHRV